MSNERGATLYDILGVNPSASTTEIKARYHQRAIQLHPDKNQGGESSYDEFVKIRNAWKVLGDEEKRREYDTSLRVEAARESSKRSSATSIGPDDCEEEDVVDEEGNPLKVYTFSCRCGETLEFYPEDDDILGCHGCSLAYDLCGLRTQAWDK